MCTEAEFMITRIDACVDFVEDRLKTLNKSELTSEVLRNVENALPYIFFGAEEGLQHIVPRTGFVHKDVLECVIAWASSLGLDDNQFVQGHIEMLKKRIEG